MNEYNFTQQEWEHCIKVLKELKEDPFNNPNNLLFSGLVAKIYKKAKKQKGDKAAQTKRREDFNVLQESTIFDKALQKNTLYSEGEKETLKEYKILNKPKNCYACNNSFKEVHFFYSRMCPKCAEENYDSRFNSVNLKNRNVIITGGRVKIGYATALKLLRAAANVIVTTRFPASALQQFKEEKDYDFWKNNLIIYGLDLRNLTAVKEFISFYKTKYSTLDILVNNAAQTIKYIDAYYLPLEQKEQELLLNVPSNCIANTTSVLQETNLLVSSKEYESFEINRFGQPIDSRDKTSWNSTLEEVSMYELLEVNLINQISPYFLIKELTPLLKKTNFKQRFIINVTSPEGQFSYHNKTIFHPHTNMTKAALNMMTRTAGKQFAKEHDIFMYAVDVGWVSTGAKEVLRKKQFERGYIPPLDSVDGASRIFHPIIKGIKETPILAGTLLKNYKIENW